MALRRDFVKFALENEQALAIRDLLRNESFSRCPDEQYFATLSHNPQLGVPGACLKVYEDDTDILQRHGLIRFKKWYGVGCYTKTNHGICILGTPDVMRLNTAPELFANKMHASFCPEAYDCLEYLLTRRAENPVPFNTSWYAKRFCSREHA